MFKWFFWIGLSLSVWAQNDMIANINLQFRFINPGARAQAMGGAFVGLADDPTAVFANPAGLTRMRSTTFGLELASTDWDNQIPFYAGTIRQTGLQDFEFNLQSRNFPQSVQTIPFVCYIRPQSEWKWGVFYAEQAQFKRDFSTESVVIPHEPDDDRDVADFTTFYFFPSENRLRLTQRELGMSLARQFGNVSVGLTLAFSQFQYDAETTLLFPAIFPDGHPLDPFENAPAARIEVDGKDQALSGAFGLLYHPNDRFSLGLAYRYQPQYDYDFAVDAFDFAMGGLAPNDSGQAPFHLPDSFSAGLSFRPTEAFLTSVEVNRIQYSELVQDYHHFFDTGGYTQTVSDQTEYRVGFEYFLLQWAHPLALRAGYWFEPYHALKNTFLDTQILYRDEERFQQIRNAVFLQRFEKDSNHLTAGFGLNWTDHWVIDFSGDWSEQQSSYSLSAQYRF
ncbi:MAG: outer membrane protein transport protein [Acidobacteria bacterium]|nr:outer membrane protein transport protein [Acidobacteriota bacterium]MCB9398840.1 outer membrane protein transport protein [Acidobacteriota bacterium]